MAYDWIQRWIYSIQMSKKVCLWYMAEHGGGFMTHGWTWRWIYGTWMNMEVHLWYLASPKGRFMRYDWTRRQVQLTLVGDLYSMWSQAVVIQEEEAVTDNFCTLYQHLYSDQEKTGSSPCIWQREGLVNPKDVRHWDSWHSPSPCKTTHTHPFIHCPHTLIGCTLEP